MINMPGEYNAISATVAASLDVTLNQYRKTTTKDSGGSASDVWVLQGSFLANVVRPSDTQLTIYASRIGAQYALVIRVMPSVNLLPNDRVGSYQGKNWLVQNILSAESYTVANEFLITSVP